MGCTPVIKSFALLSSKMIARKKATRLFLRTPPINLIGQLAFDLRSFLVGYRVVFDVILHIFNDLKLVQRAARFTVQTRLL